MAGGLRGGELTCGDAAIVPHYPCCYKTKVREDPVCRDVASCTFGKPPLAKLVLGVVFASVAKALD